MADESEFCRRRIAEELTAADTKPNQETEEAHRKMAEINATCLKLLNNTDYRLVVRSEISWIWNQLYG